MMGDICVCGERISGYPTMDKGMVWHHSNSKTEREADHEAAPMRST